MCDKPQGVTHADEIRPGVASDTRLEITKYMTEAELFWHRARHLMYLPPDKFVGTNNIKSFLMNFLDEVELTSRCFDSIDLNKDGSWRGHT